MDRLGCGKVGYTVIDVQMEAATLVHSSDVPFLRSFMSFD